jgi:hypothetical protein
MPRGKESISRNPLFVDFGESPAYCLDNGLYLVPLSGNSVKEKLRFFCGCREMQSGGLPVISALKTNQVPVFCAAGLMSSLAGLAI